MFGSVFGIMPRPISPNEQETLRNQLYAQYFQETIGAARQKWITERSRQVKKAFILDINYPKKQKKKAEQHLLITKSGEDPKLFSFDEEKEQVKFLYKIERSQFQEMIRSLGDC